MIIDTHTHLGLDGDKDEQLEVAEWFRELEGAGIDGALVCGLRGLLTPTEIPEDNDRVARTVRRRPGRLAGFGTVNPFAHTDAIVEAKRCFTELGLKGLKLHPWVQGFKNMLGPEMHALCKACAEHDAMLLFHDGTPNVSMPSQVAELAHTHPDVTFILGHSGLLHLWRQASDAAALYANIYVTLCGPHPAALRYICTTVPIERIVWGSDFLGRDLRMVRYRKNLIAQLGLDEKSYRAIMGENAARLLGLHP